MYIRLHLKCRILMKREISRQISEKKNIQTPIFIKIRPVGPELCHADGQTYMTKLTFQNFTNAPTNERSHDNFLFNFGATTKTVLTGITMFLCSQVALCTSNAYWKTAYLSV